MRRPSSFVRAAVAAAAPRGFRPLFAFLLALLCAATLSAHALHITRLGVVVSPEEAELRIDLNLAPFLGDDYDELVHASAPPQDARLSGIAREILAGLAPVFDPPGGGWSLVSYKLPAPPDAASDNPDELGATTFVWRSRLPAPPADAAFQVVSQSDSRVEFPVACSLSLAGREGAFTKWLQRPGDATKPLKLSTLAAAPPTGSATTAGGGQPRQRLATVGQYLWLGFLHILPLGLDHILFVLGLYFLGSGWRALAAQIGTFTLAHTTTLGLAAAGIVRVSPAIVEPLIALSISFVALENIFRPRVGPGRLVAVFCFGLLHGLGFAGALSELELPRDQFFAALLSFNFGVDFGQLAVLALAFLTVGWFRARPWYRTKIAIPACALIAATGVYWTVERAFF